MGFSRTVVRAYDYLMFVYFVLHVPITMLVDSQSIIPRKYYPSWAIAAVDNHVKDHGDHLVGTNPLWFVSLVWFEVCLQLPFFLPLAWGILKESSWARIPCIIYGAHVSTTLIPMLAEFYFAGEKPNYLALAIYLPYFLLPLALIFRAWFFWGKPAGGSKKSKAKRA